MKCILPVAGQGTRMYPLGATTPKCLLRILNKPIIEWSLSALAENNVDEVIIVINGGEFGQQIRDYVQTSVIDKNKFGMKIHFVVQQEQLGTAHVVQTAEDYFELDEEFLFLSGDDLHGPKNIRQVLDHAGLAVMGMKVPDPEKWGILQADDHGQLQQIVEKPDNFVGDLASVSCMKLDSRIFEIFDQLQVSQRGEYELTDSLNILAKEESIQVLTTVDYWISIGYPWHILDATEYFMSKAESKIEGRVEDNVVIKGRVILPESSTILAGTYIEGNVLVGHNVVIGPNAHLRGDITIGHNAFIGFSVEIKNSVIGNYSRISHLSYVGDSVLGNDVNIAAGSVTANFRHDGNTIHTPVKNKMVDTKRQKLGSIMGDGVRLGINTSIYPGRKIGPYQKTLPGQVVDKDII